MDWAVVRDERKEKEKHLLAVFSSSSFILLLCCRADGDGLPRLVGQRRCPIGNGRLRETDAAGRTAPDHHAQPRTDPEMAERLDGPRHSQPSKEFFFTYFTFHFVCVFLFSRAHKCIQDNKSSVLELENAADSPVHQVTFGVKQTVQEAAVVLIKDFKNPRPGPSIYRVSTLLLFGYISILTNVCIMQFKKKDPLMLSHCTISSEADELPNFFEIHHIVTKESFICQTVDAGQTQQWLHRLRLLSLGLGRWKQRRNALPHVMMIN